jgi:hypothetical protein
VSECTEGRVSFTFRKLRIRESELVEEVKPDGRDPELIEELKTEHTKNRIRNLENG